MVKRKAKRTIIVAGAVLFVLLLTVGTVALLQSLRPSEDDPYRQDSSETQPSPAPQSQPSQPSPQPSQQSAQTPDTTNTPDPETVSTINIDSMGLTVSYVKGVGGFEYQVARTPSGSQYVQFSSPELVGTRCTNDAGTFASILVSPSENERTTLTKTTTVEGTTYGLSLTDETCTRDADLLKRYQASFSDAFTLLKKIQ